MILRNPIARAAVARLLIIGSGLLWYVVVEGWSLVDAAYMVVLTITTVGYQEVHPLSTQSRIFNLFFMVAGVGVVLYILTVVVRSFIEEQFLENFFRRRWMRGKLAGMSGHFIVCGFGRVGKEVSRQLEREGAQFVVIDNASERSIGRADGEFPMIHGDATMDATLFDAGVARAKCLLASVGKDSDNVFITLSARRINPSITIVARSTSPETVDKLKIAGANRVVSPSEIAGRRMAMGALRPHAVDVFDTLSERSPHGQRIAEVVVTDDSPLCGHVVRDIHSEAGVHILAIAKRTGDLLVTPTEGEPVELGDAVMLVGPDEHPGKLEGKDA